MLLKATDRAVEAEPAAALGVGDAVVAGAAAALAEPGAGETALDRATDQTAITAKGVAKSALAPVPGAGGGATLGIRQASAGAAGDADAVGTADQPGIAGGEGPGPATAAVAGAGCRRAAVPG